MSIFFLITLVIYLLGNAIAADVRWEPKMHQAAIAESWLTFLQANMPGFRTIVYKNILGSELNQILTKTIMLLEVNNTLSVKDQVERIQDALNDRFEQMSKEYAIELEGKDAFIVSFGAALEGLLWEAYPKTTMAGKALNLVKKTWRAVTFRSTPQTRLVLPRFGRELLMLPTTIRAEHLVLVLDQIVAELVSSLRTMRRLRVSDPVEARQVLHKLFEDLYEPALERIKAEPETIVIRQTRPNASGRGEGTKRKSKSKSKSKSSRNGPRRPLIQLYDTTITLDTTEKTKTLPAPFTEALSMIPAQGPPQTETSKLRKQILRLRHQFEAIWEGKSCYGSKIFPLTNRENRSCSSQELRNFSHTHQASAELMDFFISHLVGDKQKEQPHLVWLSSFTWTLIDKAHLGKNPYALRELEEILGHEKMFQTTVDKTYLLPFFYNNYWNLALISAPMVGEMQILLQSPAPPSHYAVLRACGRKILSTLADYGQAEVSRPLDWRPVEILPVNDSCTSADTRHSSALLMNIAKQLVEGERKTFNCDNWQIAALKYAVDLINYNPSQRNKDDL